MEINTSQTMYDWVALEFEEGGARVSLNIHKAEAPEVINDFLSALQDIYSLLDMDESSIKQNMIEHGIIEPDGE